MVTLTVVDEPTSYADGIRRLLDDADDEFVPSLTAENRTGVTRSNDEEWFTSIEEYVQAAMDRELLVALDGDSVVGMISFEPIEEMPTLDGYTPTNYVTEIVVAPTHRNSGISTKTWSTNHAHIAILDNLGFECVTRIPDDRGDGIDTVYYARSVTDE